jgi:hypothetical protein
VIERFLLGQLAGLRRAGTTPWRVTGELADAITALYARADRYGLQRIVLRVPHEALAERILSTCTIATPPGASICEASVTTPRSSHGTSAGSRTCSTHARACAPW